MDLSSNRVVRLSRFSSFTLLKEPACSCVHGGVGIHQQGFRVLAVSGVKGDANAEGCENIVGVDLERFFKAVKNFLRQLGRVVFLLDFCEKDDKLIAVRTGSPLFEINSIEQLNEEYPGISEILKIWFSNYKGAGETQVKGFDGPDVARDILAQAIDAYIKSTGIVNEE